MSSESIEDYIKAIFQLSRDAELVQTSAIADRLEVRPASVSKENVSAARAAIANGNERRMRELRRATFALRT